MPVSRIFCQGGRGPALTTFLFFVSFYLVLNLFYIIQRGTNVFILVQGSRGGPTFSRGVGGGGGGGWGGGGGGRVQMLISIETHITCDFPGGRRSGPPIPPSHECFDDLRSTVDKGYLNQPVQPSSELACADPELFVSEESRSN